MIKRTLFFGNQIYQHQKQTDGDNFCKVLELWES